MRGQEVELRRQTRTGLAEQECGHREPRGGGLVRRKTTWRGFPDVSVRKKTTKEKVCQPELKEFLLVGCVWRGERVWKPVNKYERRGVRGLGMSQGLGRVLV